MKADRSFFKSQRKLHREATQRAERYREKDAVIKAYMDAIAQHIRPEPETTEAAATSKTEND